jgi:hypothetical protein
MSLHTYNQFIKESVSREFYHGSPFEFKKFSISNIGSGEGVSKFGYGIYFTDRLETAQYYAERNTTGDGWSEGLNVYTVRLLEVSSYLDWNDEAPEHLVNKLASKLEDLDKEEGAEKLLDEYQEYVSDYGSYSVSNLYNHISYCLDGDKAASEMFVDCWVPGIHTVDEIHGGNIYVAFDDSLIKITNVEKMKLRKPRNLF